jgi:hypothetical protein
MIPFHDHAVELLRRVDKIVHTNWRHAEKGHLFQALNERE